jgi:hypothetical protein
VRATDVAAGKSVVVSNGLAEAVGWPDVVEGISAVKAGLVVVGFAGVPVDWDVQAVINTKHSRMPDRK